MSGNVRLGGGRNGPGQYGIYKDISIIRGKNLSGYETVITRIAFDFR